MGHWPHWNYGMAMLIHTRSLWGDPSVCPALSHTACSGPVCFFWMCCLSSGFRFVFVLFCFFWPYLLRATAVVFPLPTLGCGVMEKPWYFISLSPSSQVCAPVTGTVFKTTFCILILHTGISLPYLRVNSYQPFLISNVTLINNIENKNVLALLNLFFVLDLRMHISKIETRVRVLVRPEKGSRAGGRVWSTMTRSSWGSWSVYCGEKAQGRPYRSLQLPEGRELPDGGRAVLPSNQWRDERTQSQSARGEV